MKALVEKRGALSSRMKELIDGIKTEERAFTEEESTEFAQLEKDIKAIDDTIAAEQRAESALADTEVTEERGNDMEMETRAASEIVADYIRGNELRANEMTTTSTGGIIPEEFSKDIIHETVALSGVLNLVSMVNSKGIYKQIKTDTDTISAGWTDEIASITASEANFDTIDIGHYKLAALSKLSLELINQNDFDITSEVIYQTERDFALKLETAVIKGTGVKQPTGLVSAGTAFTTASNAAITADEIVKIYHKLKAPFQQDAVWIMSNDTLCAVRLLTDAAGRYIFHQNENLTSGYAGYILGKPVLVSDAMDNIGASKKPILFGDFGRAYKGNMNPEMTMQVLNEKYADQGMKGVLSIIWFDGKPVNSEAYVTVGCPA